MLFLLACAATKPTVDAPVATDTAHVADTGAADSGGSPDDTAPDDTAGDTAPVHRWSGEYEAYRAAHGRISDVAGPWLAAGDLDGDGTADIVTGRSTSDGAGEAWAFHADAASAEDAFATVTGPEALGGGVPGDLDGDGLVDLVLAGAEGASLLPGPLGGTRTIDDAATTLDGGGTFAGLDHDGDGALDLAVGDDAASVVHLLRGPLPARALARELDAVATIRGGDGDGFGAAVRAVGDLDGDGAEDLAVIAPWSEPAEGTRGAAYVFFGPVAGVLDAAADADTQVYAPGARVSEGISAAADLDGDGHGDLVVGADGALVFAGPLARGVHTDADATAVVPVDRAPCGKALDASADLDRDGRGDLVLGCPSWGHTSAARLWYGPLSGTVGEPDATFVDTGRVDQFGSVVTALGDVNGDGVDDLGLTDPETVAPDVYLFFGGRR